MAEQNLKNHIRFYPPHHFVFYPVALIMIALAVFFAVKNDFSIIWIFLAATVFLIAWVAFMLRQHYALTLQDRIIFLEMRYCYFVLTGDRFELLEKNLSKSQIFALRFASDVEFPALAQKAAAEKLSPQKIKESISNWKADRQRV